MSSRTELGLPIRDAQADVQLLVGSLYRRQDLHRRFGGNRFKGIVVSTREPLVLLFHTEEPTQQFYEDGFDSSGLYWYSGEGTKGDMQWTAANKAIRDHEADSRDLFVFERAQRKDGIWKLSFVATYVDHTEIQRPDRHGTTRSAIVFALSPCDDYSGTSIPDAALATLSEARALATSRQVSSAPTIQRLVTVQRRSAAVRAYALLRAAGRCEACEAPAPFATTDGPFLEVHHIDRLADGGPDRIDRVAGVCPNCHRRCHLSADAKEFNDALRTRVTARESSLNAL